MDYTVLFVAIVTFVSTFVGGHSAIRFRKVLQYFFAFSAGSLIAVSFFDLLPESLRANHGFPDRRTALMEAHFPPPGTPAARLDACRTPAQTRLIFEEFFLFQCGLVSHRLSGERERKPLVPVVDDRVRAAAKAVLPFALTPGQRSALKEIVDDMRRPRQMNRLLQGDVGAGKTAVALLASVVALENRQQVAVMVPTEILAAQHRETIKRWFDGRGYASALLTGSTPPAERREVLAGLRSGALQIVVGTHALIEEDVTFARLGRAFVTGPTGANVGDLRIILVNPYTDDYSLAGGAGFSAPPLGAGT